MNYEAETLKSGSFKKPLSKVFLIAAVLVAPLILLAVILYPLISKNGSAKYIENYHLPQSFTRANLDTIVEKMHQDTEYQFYFRMLGPTSRQRAVDAVYQILDKSRNKEQHFQQIQSLKAQIQSKALVLNSLDYPPDLAANIAKYPDIISKFWDFLGEEFQLTILGLVYKATYDSDFQFTWNDATRQSAQKLESIFYSFTDDQRKEIEENMQAKPL
jgi:hypothetical protein